MSKPCTAQFVSVRTKQLGTGKGGTSMLQYSMEKMASC